MRNLKIIGETVKKIPDEVKNKHADTEWRKIAGPRNVLIHEYFSLDSEARAKIAKRIMFY